MPPKDKANWTANPEDVTNLIKFFHNHRGSMGDGGNWKMAQLNEAADYMAKLGPPVKGGPKTANAIGSKWKEVRASTC
jgi:hypothetical protein